MINIKFYKIKSTRYHPSIEVSNDGRYWKNLEFTSNPTKTGRYIKLDDNPTVNNKTRYVRKYLRNDPIRIRGDNLDKYKLSSSDKKIILDYFKKKLVESNTALFLLKVTH